MALVGLGPVLAEARDNRYAVPAFNPVDYATMKTMVAAAEEVNSPVIVQTSAKTVRYYSHGRLPAGCAKLRPTRRFRSCCTSITARTST